MGLSSTRHRPDLDRIAVLRQVHSRPGDGDLRGAVVLWPAAARLRAYRQNMPVQHEPSVRPPIREGMGGIGRTHGARLAQGPIMVVSPCNRWRHPLTAGFALTWST